MDLYAGKLAGAGLGQAGGADSRVRALGVPWMQVATSGRRVRTSRRDRRTTPGAMSADGSTPARTLPTPLVTRTTSPAAGPFAAGDLGGCASRAVVEPAVQAGRGVVGDQEAGPCNARGTASSRTLISVRCAASVSASARRSGPPARRRSGRPRPCPSLCRRRSRRGTLTTRRSCRPGPPAARQLPHAARQDRGKIAKALKPVYTASDEAAATHRFEEFQDAWGKKDPAIVRLREDAWAEFVPFLAFDAGIRKVGGMTAGRTRAGYAKPLARRVSQVRLATSGSSRSWSRSFVAVAIRWRRVLRCTPISADARSQ